MDIEGSQPDEVAIAARIWQAKDGSSWLVSFALAEIDGRLECVGMTIRSYLMKRAGTTEDPDAPGSSYRTGPIGYDTPEWGELAGDDVEATLLTEGYRVLTTPKVLDAQTMRQLPFADVLTRARRDTAQFLRRLDGVLRSRGRGSTFDQGADAVEARYKMEELQRAAAAYTDAYRSGSNSPTKDVAESLGVSRNIAAKLIHRCRAPEIGLLAPTEKGKAGGLRRTADPPARAVSPDSEREETP